MREEKKAEKRQELVGVCLDCFVEKGLTRPQVMQMAFRFSRYHCSL